MVANADPYFVVTPGRPIRIVRDLGLPKKKATAGLGWAALGINPSTAYDIGSPGAASEIKYTLIELAKYESDPLRKKGGQLATETAWTKIDASTPYWDAATADEFAIAMGRYANEFGCPGCIDTGPVKSIPGPYLQMSATGPQPLAQGLELLAGAALEHLGIQTMPLYMKWRDTGCTACFAPPSKVSKPDANAPVKPTEDYGPRLIPPPAELDKDAGAAEALASIDKAMQQAWVGAASAKDEASRAATAGLLNVLRIHREALVKALIDRAKPRQGQTVVDPAIAQICIDHGGVWNPNAPPDQSMCQAPGSVQMAKAGVGIGAVIAVGALAAVGYSWWWHKKRDPLRKARRS